MSTPLTTRQHPRLTAFAILFALLTAPVLAQTDASPLKPGSIFPSIARQSLTGKWLSLPAATYGRSSVIICSFSRAAGRDARDWSQHLAKDEPHLPVYTVIFLETVPRLFRSLVVSQIKRSMPLGMQAQTLIVYKDEDLWKRRLHLSSDSHACVILLSRNAHIEWITTSGFTGSSYSDLKTHLRPTR